MASVIILHIIDTQQVSYFFLSILFDLANRTLNGASQQKPNQGSKAGLKTPGIEIHGGTLLMDN